MHTQVWHVADGKLAASSMEDYQKSQVGAELAKADAAEAAAKAAAEAAAQ